MRSYIVAATEVGAPVQVVLRTVVHRYGAETIAALAQLRTCEVEEAINPRKNVSVESLSKLLGVFDLKLTVSGIDEASADDRLMQRRGGLGCCKGQDLG
jgi:hypothetical protein